MSEKINCGNCDMLLYYGEEISRRLYMRAIPDEAAVFDGLRTPVRAAAILSDDTVKVEIKRRKTHVS